MADNSNAQNQPGALFGFPKYGTGRRLVPDAGNENLGATPLQNSPVKVQTTRLDQLDIVQGWKTRCSLTGRYTAGSGKTITASPFGIAAAFGDMNVKLQAAYSTFNLPGPLAALMQGYRPMWGSRNSFSNLASVDPFAGMVPFVADGADHTYNFSIDMPVGIKIDEYYNLTASGDPQQRIMDAIVSPAYMAAQARTVFPSIPLNAELPAGNTLNAPNAIALNDSTSTFTNGAFSARIYRDAYWTSNNPAANPIQYPWLYTRDYFTQPTNGQPKVSALIQNTGVSVGQVLSLTGFVWDPDANSGFGAVVPFSSISNFEFVTGGSLQNISVSPGQLQDQMFSMHPQLFGVGAWGVGAFLFDFALSHDGSYLTNANAINTYLLNGVSLNISFKSGLTPGSQSVVYIGVEALKLVTS